MKFKKFVFAMISCLVIAGGSFGVYADNSTEPSQTQYIEQMTLDESADDPLVLEYIEEYCQLNPEVAPEVMSMYADEASIADLDYMECAEQVVEDVNEDLEDAGLSITIDDVVAYNNKFDCWDDMKDHVEKDMTVQEDTDVFVMREASTQAVNSVWYITYITNSSGFSIKATVLGSPIDRISGDVTMYHMSGINWASTSVTDGAFVVNEVSGGVFYTWNIPADYVKEKFEYNITVTEGTTHNNYKNEGEDDQCRYNFVVGSFAGIQARGGDRHHYISKAALGEYHYNTNQAYCIRMLVKDH